MNSLKQIQAAITDLYDSSSDAVSTIRRVIDNPAIALERLEDESYAAVVSEKRAAKKRAAKKSATKAKGKK